MHHLRPLVWPSIGTQSFRSANIGINLRICLLCHSSCEKINFPIKKYSKDVKSQFFFFPFQNFCLWFEAALSSRMGLPPPPLFPLIITFFPIPCQTPDATVGGKKKELLRTYIFKWLLSDVFNPVALQRRCSHIWGGPARQSPQLITGLGCVCARRSLGGSVHAVLQPPVRNSVGGRAARRPGGNF